MTPNITEDYSKLILKLFEIDAIKFGEFKLKSDIISPVYIDLRVIISYPSTLQEISNLLWKVSKGPVSFDQLCGVPYTALPIATCISIQEGMPMLIRRKEMKDYGTKKMVEGVFEKGQNCLIIEDVVTTGSSVKETAQVLRNEGIQVTNAIVILDRDQGGSDELLKDGIQLKSLFTLPQVLDVLVEADKICSVTAEEVKKFLSTNSVLKSNSTNGKTIFQDTKVNKSEKIYPLIKQTTKTFADRAKMSKNSVTIKLMSIIETKKTNLCLSADVESAFELLELAESLGPYICCIKTHADALSHFNLDIMVKLQIIAQKLNFVVFEDRKFADIGNTVKTQLSGGLHHIADWADIINAHSLPGPGVISGLQAGAKMANSKLGLLLIAQMSPKGCMITDDYTKQTVEMAEEFSDFVCGFISTSKVSNNPSHLHFTPGVKLEPGCDSLGQQYVTPTEAILNRGSDIIIVGRGIIHSTNRKTAAKSFRDAAWSAYLSRCNL